MNESASRVVAAWVRDLVIAYTAGLVVGAPLATVFVWATGRRPLVTPIIVVSMLGMLFWRRRVTTREGARTGKHETTQRLAGAKQGCAAL